MLDWILIAIALAAGGGTPSRDGAEAAAASVGAPVPAGGGAALVAEPQVPSGRFTTATEVRPILSATRGNWVAVREFGGQDLVYVTHLMAWRCGLVQLKLGVNGAAPEVWPLPPCHEDTAAPNALLPEDGLPYRGFAPGSVEALEIEITYDDLGTDRATFRRAEVLMP